MKKSIKKAWIKALRSGKYKQGNYRLCDLENQFCCLGVLYDACYDGYWERDLNSWRACGESAYLPDNVLAKLELTHKEMFTLAEMNDAERKPFNEIADYIEKNL